MAKPWLRKMNGNQGGRAVVEIFLAELSLEMGRRSTIDRITHLE